MRRKNLAAIGSIIFLFALLGGGILWLSTAHVAPPATTIEQAVPDDHIPH